MIFDARGNIVTNAHVIAGGGNLVVTLADGHRYPATVVGSYAPDDLAVITIGPSRPLKPARFADSSKAEVGDIVLAAGNPLGLQSSITDGIVSAVRDIASQIIQHGRAVDSHRASLGVSLERPGALVGALQPGGPAERAGIVVGDSIYAIGGKDVSNAEALATALAGLQPGQTVDVAITRPDGTSAKHQGEAR